MDSSASTVPVSVPAVLHAVDQNDLVVFEDLVDDAVVLTLNPVGELRQVRLELGERESVTHTKPSRRPRY